MGKLIDFDLELLSLIGKDARQSSETLAKKLNVSSATVRRRLQSFYKDDLLRITGVVDPAKFGFTFSVVIAIDVEPDTLDSVIQSLVNEPKIWWASTTTGQHDIMCVARFSSPDDLSDFLVNVIGKIPGIKDSETSVCLDVKKGRYVPIVSFV